MRVMFSSYTSGGDVEPTPGFAVHLSGEERAAPAATGVMPTGAWR
ncbi:MAG: hypothetical protein WAM39_06330 [Bryobacteraceae bacterium]